MKYRPGSDQRTGRSSRLGSMGGKRHDRGFVVHAPAQAVDVDSTASDIERSAG